MPEPLGMMAASATDAILGLALQGQQDRRQLRQQEKLQQLEMAGQRQMTDYNMMKQMEMWRNTNYTAQMEQLRKAGLNPGLIYGMGGGGGQTTNIEAGKVTGANAPTGGNEIASMIGMGLTRELQKAQIENIKAQTEKTRTENAAIPSNVSKTEAETESITQGIENQKAQQDLIEPQRHATEVASDINARSSNSQVAAWAKKVEEQTEQVRAQLRENNINDKLIEQKIQSLTAQYAQVAIDNALKEATTGKTNQEIEAIKQQIGLNKIDEEMAKDGFNPKAGGLLKIIYNALRLIATIGR